MTKRPNPFAEDYIPQSKVHIGSKQFNDEDRLKKVYEKTLELLFKGAKKSSAIEHLNNNNMHYTKKEEKMKQLFIGKDGTLLQSGCLNWARKEQECAGGGSACSRCREAVGGASCAYCERRVCGGCERACARCLATHCLQCVLFGSEGSEVCISCYG